MSRNSARVSSPDKASRRVRAAKRHESAHAITAVPAPLALEPPSAQAPAESPAELHHRMIAEAAYFRALNRGFNGGDPQEDWYVAEREIRHALGAHS